jgi:hypothetical protein
MATATIRTAYKPYPGSNVGQVVATASGRQAARRVDQSMRAEENHRAAALILAARLGVPLGEEVESNDSGTVRRFAVLPRCEWFALCDHPATGTMPHPILGDVPICDRCRTRVEDAR